MRAERGDSDAATAEQEAKLLLEAQAGSAFAEQLGPSVILLARQCAHPSAFWMGFVSCMAGMATIEFGGPCVRELLEEAKRFVDERAGELTADRRINAPGGRA